MNSTFSWLDYSDRDRKRAMEVVDLFGDEDTRDELGVGVIRDAFADRLFPGTSTIQTRLRYFLFVPWVIAELDSGRVAAGDFASEIRRWQDRLRKGLIEGGETNGVIGFRAGGDVQRLPSSIYWQGLRRWGILRFQGSEFDYGRTPTSRGSTSVGSPDDDPEAGVESVLVRWDPRLPKPRKDWLSSTTFELSEEEAEYLTHRVRMAAPDSLMMFLIDAGADPRGSGFVWELPATGDLPAALDEELAHARNFSEGMHGAFLLYNLLLSEEKKDEARVEQYEAWIAEWWQACEERGTELHDWDRPRFWALLAGWGVRVTPPTRRFVESWLDVAMRARRVEEILREGGARSLIAARERILKGPRARLGNARALNVWNGASGTAQLDYRWGRPVQSMLTDLLRAAGKIT